MSMYYWPEKQELIKLFKPWIRINPDTGYCYLASDAPSEAVDAYKRCEAMSWYDD